MNRFRRMQSYYYVDNTDGAVVNPALPAMRDYSIYGSSIQNGTPTPDNPVEVQSVGDLVTEGEHAGKYKIPVNVRSKNLFDVTKCVSFSSEKGGIFLGADVERYKNQGNLKNIANVEAGKTYVISAQSTSSAGGLYVYLNGSKRVWNFYNNTAPGTKILELTQEDLDGGIYFYKSGSMAEAPAEVIISNIQIEENTIATGYEPYHEPSGAVIYLDEPLRKIDDKADYINFANKKVVRNIGKSVLSPEGGYSYYLWNNKHGIMWKGLSESGSLKKGLCNRENHFSQAGVDVHAMWLGVGNNPYIYWVGILDALNIYSAEKTNGEMIAEFKTWLESNPTYVCYPLTTPVSEAVDLPAVKLGKNTNIITVGTDIQPSAVNWQYYKY